MIVSVVLILVSVAVYGLVHSLLASNRFKTWFNAWLGEPGSRYSRLFYNLVGLITLAPVLALVIWLPNRPLYTVSMPWLILFLAMEVGAILLVVLAVSHTGILRFLGLDAFLARGVAGSDPRTGLVTTGLYRWMRHPLYTAGFLFMLFAPVMSVNLLAMYAGLAIYLVVGAHFEERKLLAAFGEEYAAYRRRTPKFLPWPFGQRKPG